MIVCIIGSRSYSSYEKVEHVLSNLNIERLLVHSGTIDGANKLVKKYAEKRDILIEEGDSKANIKSADIVIAFWDCISNGTKRLIDFSLKMNKKVTIVP